jgi:spermidine synthase
MKDDKSLELWVRESHEDFYASEYRLKRTLFSEQSAFQQVDVVETTYFGKMLLNDGLVMVTERDEFIYHEMMAHVPLFLHPNPKKVLVIGGGDGGTVREVIRHPQVEHCRLVEIDEAVVRACKEYIPLTSNALSDPKVIVDINDGVKFVAETDERFDVVMVDSTDPIGPAQPLFGTEFYENIKRVLTEDGIVVSQGESPFFNQNIQKSLLGVLGQVFKKVHLYNFANLTYPGGYWSFTYASEKICPLKNFQESRVKELGLEMKYYNARVHKAAFALPEFIQKALCENLTDF